MTDETSLRQAIETTNAQPGAYTIRFAVGRIALKQDLPALTGGGVTIDGEGVTLTGRRDGTALQIASSGNTVRGLTLDGFRIGVDIGPYWDHTLGGSMPTHATLADNIVSGLVMRRVRAFGVRLWSVFSPVCGAPRRERCWSYTTWRRTTIRDNTIETADSGINAKINNAGDRVEGVTVTGNEIRIAGHDSGIGFETLGDADRARISDVVISRNTVVGSSDIGINILSGGIRAQRSVVERVRILDNRVRISRATRGFCCGGIVVQAGSDDPSFTSMVAPARYLDDNVLRDVLVRRNTLSGTLDVGVSVQAGSGAGGRRNRVERIRVEGNLVTTSKPAVGVGVSLGGGVPFRRRYASGNRISGVSILANRITLGRGPEPENAGNGEGAGGVVVSGGGNFSRYNAVRDVRITRNAIATLYAGIRIVGGLWPTARGNSVSCVRLAANRITGAQRAVSVVANHRGAAGNRVTLRC